MLTSFKRILKTGLRNFWRNASLSAATIFIMTMVVFLMTILFIFNIMAGILIENIRDKVDIAVYFKETAGRENIMDLKSKLSQMQEVKNVDFIPKESALDKFVERHKEDPVLMDSLTEIGNNPFVDSLTIKVWQPSQYGPVADYLNGASAELIGKVDYFERKSMIDKALSISSGIREAVMIISLILGVVALFIAFNAIKLAIYHSKDEISVMRLVGAGNTYIRGPFIIQGILIGIIAVFFVALITFGIACGFDAKIRNFAPGISTFQIYMANFWALLALQLVNGIGLGIVASMFAMRKHLKV